MASSGEAIARSAWPSLSKSPLANVCPKLSSSSAAPGTPGDSWSMRTDVLAGPDAVPLAMTAEPAAA